MWIPSRSLRTRPSVPGLDIGETRARLRRLNVWEWFRWCSVLFIALLLVGGVFSMALPYVNRDWQLHSNVSSLFALVLLFAAYAVYQQLIINRLRSDLASQMGMAATIEMLKPPADPDEPGYSQHRRYDRFHFDQRVSIDAVVRGSPTILYGRTSDISEGGVGAVIPESLSPGEQIAIHLPIGKDHADLVIQAVVRHRRGFYHGCEFLGATDPDCAAIRAACLGAIPVAEYRQDLRTSTKH